MFTFPSIKKNFRKKFIYVVTSHDIAKTTILEGKDVRKRCFIFESAGRNTPPVIYSSLKYLKTEIRQRSVAGRVDEVQSDSIITKTIFLLRMLKKDFQTCLMGVKYSTCLNMFSTLKPTK